MDDRINLIEVENFKLKSPVKTIKELRQMESDVQLDIINLHSSIAEGFGRIAFKGKSDTIVYTPYGYLLS